MKRPWRILRFFDLFRAGTGDAGLERGALHRLSHPGVHIEVQDRRDELPGGGAAPMALAAAIFIRLLILRARALSAPGTPRGTQARC